ncbi:hypothetical protein [Dictyobacter formicarum]|uniref:Uncharacterized protein n=1 Tax=Dictyobacter formicarum TaxID=2778368 RepID=A0ABQ3VHP9_9CHLR|nr:hypothetical protein [Dictyobacter formicarum]GHO85219.1 hypothetical protein KSZ_32250 [Dictyobacter formicarum]
MTVLEAVETLKQLQSINPALAQAEKILLQCADIKGALCTIISSLIDEKLYRLCDYPGWLTIQTHCEQGMRYVLDIAFDILYWKRPSVEAVDRNHLFAGMAPRTINLHCIRKHEADARDIFQFNFVYECVPESVRHGKNAVARGDILQIAWGDSNGRLMEEGIFDLGTPDTWEEGEILLVNGLKQCAAIVETLWHSIRKTDKL